MPVVEVKYCAYFRPNAKNTISQFWESNIGRHSSLVASQSLFQIFLYKKPLSFRDTLCCKISRWKGIVQKLFEVNCLLVRERLCKMTFEIYLLKFAFNFNSIFFPLHFQQRVQKIHVQTMPLILQGNAGIVKYWHCLHSKSSFCKFIVLGNTYLQALF